MKTNNEMANSMPRLIPLSIAIVAILAGCVCAEPQKSWQRLAAEKAYAELDGVKDDMKRGAIRDYVKALLSFEKGGDPDRQFSQNRTLLMMAVIRNDKEMVERLLSLDVYADVDLADENGDTPLIVACEKDNVEIVEKLIKAGASVNLQNNNGVSVLMACAMNGNITLFKCLREAGADPSLKDNKGCLWGNYATSGGHKDMISVIVNSQVEEGK